ncbi:hypothetical protein [Alkalicoccus halolimnae]|uniref:Uncharacterized protein n=1 Tax=Alkalicoccus halolimnae TaxID=1667239 RepID=A0A5C7F2Q9_9BACI|nr:hypothetical protein [Alkalicoccus halolimnae]TXF81691.1 hypothetical protein FTX54_15670 [Alkalicoccus halolimnae]
MKKIGILILLSHALFLSACLNGEQGVPLSDDIKEISISESEGFSGINADFFLVMRETSKVEEIMKNAEEVETDVAENGAEENRYDFVIKYESEGARLLHLFLGDKGEKSLFTFTGYDQEGYETTPEETAALRRLLE